MKNKECDNCGEETSRRELGRKVRGEYLCKKCKVIKRASHRKKTIEDSGIKEDLRLLRNKIARESGVGKRAYAKKVGRPVRTYIKGGAPPIPKGSKIKKKRPQTNCYISKSERQSYFRILLNRGINEEEAKKRMQRLTESQRGLRKKLSQADLTEKEFKVRQREMLEELWEE